MQVMKIASPALARCNSAIQHNGVDCGVFVLHYWEGEVRRFNGEGWPLKYPRTSGEIRKRKERLVGLVKQVVKFTEDLLKAEEEGDDKQDNEEEKEKRLP